jgi:hypothetical protein
MPGGHGCVLCSDDLVPVVRESAHWRAVVNRNQNLLAKLLLALARHEEKRTRVPRPP